jgi:putative ATP-dependent endonuclease of OLD family
MTEGSETVGDTTRLSKLIVRNFRCIGTTPVEIDLNDIVVLVGPNNSGKSSILRAYETIMCDGAAESQLTLDDFPSGVVNGDALPEIELHTIVYGNAPGEEWCKAREDEGHLVRERWVWKCPGKPERRGYNVQLAHWAEDGDEEKVPWGVAPVANARRPQPHRVNAFDPPEVQTDEILRFLDAVLEEKLKSHQKDGEKSHYSKLLSNIRELQGLVVDESEESIQKIQDDLSKLIGKVFPKHKVVFDPRPEDEIEKSFKFFTAQSQLRMGPEAGFLSTIDKQGSGARRTLLWTALKLLADQGVRARPQGSKAKTPLKTDPARPHLLLLDEPETCLHPAAIRDACDLLYGLPTAGNWQVMITTHSPCFVDFARDNTTIVRVEFSDAGDVKGTTIFRPDRVALDDDDKRRLKLLNLCDPYVAEFFFGGKAIIVEGDTEHTAFGYVRQMNPDEFGDIQVIRARGKATIVSLMKILNHFGAPYSVLHDCDTKKVQKRDGSEMTNPAWSKNADIISQAANEDIRVVASVPHFEVAYFGEKVHTEKPYAALTKLREHGPAYDKVRKLLLYLARQGESLPEGAIRITKAEDIDYLNV